MADVEINHGTMYAYVRHKCRCDLCREANRNYKPKKSRPEQKHGKAPYYFDCDCAFCKESRKADKHPELPRPLQHGKHSTYTNRGCRCKECCTAQRRYYEASRRKKWSLEAKPLAPGELHGVDPIWKKCPCPICKWAYDEHKRAKRRRKLEPLDPEPQQRK